MSVDQASANEWKHNNVAQIWCDVGGTFTDCIVVDSTGKRNSCKVLSHGMTPGRIDRWVSNESFKVQSLPDACDGFWVGATISWLDDDGSVIGRSRCSGYRASDALISVESVGDGIVESCRQFEMDCGVEAPILAARLMMGVPLLQPFPASVIRMGTTRGTNALLTRTGARTAFATTRGFADLLAIGFQERPELFNLTVKKRAPLYETVVEIDERLNAQGQVLEAINVESTRTQLKRLYETGVRSLAICLLHSYRNPEHEQIVEKIAIETGFTHVCVSSRVAGMMGAVSRGETTVVDAYLTPVVQTYLERVSEQFGSGQSHLRVMTSSGGLVRAGFYRGRDSVLSGPAGGAVALEALAHSVGQRRLIGLDMGGTSTDVCRIDGVLQIEHETIKAGVRMLTPALAIHTVAAGGGSICWFDGVQLRVGPASAGASPGPACYGRGGPLTITDLNLLAGRIDDTNFPFPLDRHAAELKLTQLTQNVISNGLAIRSEQLLAGLRRLANEQMAAAVRSISIAQGADVRNHALVGFGGAAGQHICEVAELLGIERILDPADAGVLSALGMGLSAIKRNQVRSIYQPLDRVDLSMIRTKANEMRFEAEEELRGEGVEPKQIAASYELELRYQGSEGAIRVPWSGTDLNSVELDFATLHRQRFGYDRANRGLELVALRGAFSATPDTVLDRVPLSELQIDGSNAYQCNDGKVLRSQWPVGQVIDGPVLVLSHGSTLYVEKNWCAKKLSDGTVLIERSITPSYEIGIAHNTVDLASASASSNAAETSNQSRGDADQMDPVLRDVLAQRIAAIAHQMGIVLEQTAISVNVKDRRDFSCAVFSKSGDLIANAPHVPVHLGAMGKTVKAIIDEFPCMEPGDCFVTNDPYRGGSHLPDITVITPVFAENNEGNNRQGGSPDFFVACRAHHAEVGGTAPGSMAPTSRTLGEEGVVLPPMYLAKGGSDCSSAVEHLLRSSQFPSRNPIENMADLAAQQAANQRGVEAMTELAKEYGLDTVQKYLEHIMSAADRKTRAWIRTLIGTKRVFRDAMDDGTAICVTVSASENDVEGPILSIDFKGTGPVCPGNLNANPAIVSAAVMYVVRCCIADEMPLNSGVMRGIRLNIPEGILNPPVDREYSKLPAVAGGNVETSQRIVDCLLGALGAAAASQGTMNNFLFGNQRFGYYETIGGGSGATKYGDGEHAVHTHMTNTRLTDVEILESRYPVRLVKFEIRKASGGRGKHRGGDGMIRQVMALEPLDVSLVTSRRCPGAPFGLEGGQSGALGENWLILHDGTERRLLSSVQCKLGEGDSILIKTPGGGGFGSDQVSVE